MAAMLAARITFIPTIARCCMHVVIFFLLAPGSQRESCTRPVDIYCMP